MPRYVNQFQFFASQDMLFQAVRSYLQSEGYTYTQYQSENVFKKGHGLAAGPTFIKISFAANAVRLEAWMKFAVAPGIYAGEIDLNGALGAAVKGPLKKRVAQIEAMIVQQGGRSLTNPYTAPDGSPRLTPTQPTPQKFCNHCGAQLIPNARFCSGCGRPL